MNTYKTLNSLCEALGMTFYEIPELSEQEFHRSMVDSKESQTGEENWQPYFKKYPLYGKENPKFGKSTSVEVQKLWDSRDEEYRKKFGAKVSSTRKKNKTAVGEKNPMYGRSAIKENNLKWYTDGSVNVYVPENTQPAGFIRGRIVKWSTRK